MVSVADVQGTLEPVQIVLPTEDAEGGSFLLQDRSACAEEEDVLDVAATQATREYTVGESITQTDAQQNAQPQKHV